MKRSQSLGRKLVNTIQGSLTLTLVAVASTSVYALETIPKESGVSGFINLGLAAAQVESNFLATTFNGDVELGDEQIDQLSDSPDSQSFVMPQLAFELAYTFGSSATQIYVGNSLEDFVTFDLSTRFGIRQSIGELGIIALSAVAAPLETQVWSNPYQTGVKREETVRDSSGFSLEWSGMFNTGFEMSLTSREVDIDNEESGTGLSLGDADKALLDRNGDITKASIGYRHRHNESNAFILTLTTLEHDKDGDAMSYDGYSLKLNHLYTFPSKHSLVTNFILGDYEYDVANPVFDQFTDKDLISFSSTYFHNEPFGIEGWVGNIGFAYAEEDSDVDFFDNSVMMVSAGMITRF
jgi:hypothetical protein